MDEELHTSLATGNERRWPRRKIRVVLRFGRHGEKMMCQAKGEGEIGVTNCEEKGETQVRQIGDKKGDKNGGKKGR